MPAAPVPHCLDGCGVTESRVQVYNKTSQFRNRNPTSIVYPSDDVAFIGFAEEQLPLVQVLPTAPQQGAERPEDDVAVQRQFALEHVSLMKAFQFPLTSGGTVNLLLVAGVKVDVGGAESVPQGVSPAAAPPPPSSQIVQFTVYSYEKDDPSMEVWRLARWGATCCKLCWHRA
jgi:hypothetical protein